MSSQPASPCAGAARRGNHPPLPLTEAQQRHIHAALANLEHLLVELFDRLECPSLRPLRLAPEVDGLPPEVTADLRPMVEELLDRVRQLANDLGLPALPHAVRRSLLAGLQLAAIDLEECQPQGELRGYGPLAPETATYLRREVPQLTQAVRHLTDILYRLPGPTLIPSAQPSPPTPKSPNAYSAYPPDSPQ